MAGEANRKAEETGQGDVPTLIAEFIAMSQKAMRLGGHLIRSRRQNVQVARGK